MSVSDQEVIRCAVRQKTGALTDIVNVFEFKGQGGSPPSDAQVLTAVASYFDALYNNIETGIATAQVPYDIKVDVVEIIGGLKKIVRNVGTVGWGSLYNPSDAGSVMPPAVCCLVLLRTVVGKIFGKKYLGELGESVVSHYTFEAAFITVVNAFITAALASFATSGVVMNFLPGVLSVSVAHMGEFLLFTDGEISPEPAYQRRRKLSVGS